MVILVAVVVMEEEAMVPTSNNHLQVMGLVLHQPVDGETKLLLLLLILVMLALMPKLEDTTLSQVVSKTHQLHILQVVIILISIFNEFKLSLMLNKYRKQQCWLQCVWGSVLWWRIWQFWVWIWCIRFIWRRYGSFRNTNTPQIISYSIHTLGREKLVQNGFQNRITVKSIKCPTLFCSSYTCSTFCELAEILLETSQKVIVALCLIK